MRTYSSFILANEEEGDYCIANANKNRIILRCTNFNQWYICNCMIFTLSLQHHKLEKFVRVKKGGRCEMPAFFLLFSRLHKAFPRNFLKFSKNTLRETVSNIYCCFPCFDIQNTLSLQSKI